VTTRRTRLFRAALAFAVFPAVALLAPVLARERPWVEGRGGDPVLHAPIPWDPDAADLDQRLQPPGAVHLLGTDELGRDVLSRTLHGARLSVAAGLLASALALAVGAALGAAAGWAGGAADRGVLFLVNVVQALPALVLVVAGASFLPPSFLVAALLIALTGWTDTARLVRAETKKLRTEPFVDAARAAGASSPRLVLVHVLPHALPPALALLPYALGAAVLTEAGLSFLGLGTPPPSASWGRALAEARNLLPGAWWCVLPPALGLFLLVLSARRLGDAAAARDVQSPSP
jgi:ABC-type dipeptide/oligopeptide/nickel transport system permease subunit